jgi:FlaA1/EpsC-like NDP-sugar epimerase
VAFVMNLPGRSMRHLRTIKILPHSLDILVLISSFVSAYLLRFDFNIPQNQLHNLSLQLPYVVALELAALHLFGCHKLIWRLVNLADLQAFIKAAVCAVLPILLLRLVLPNSIGEFRVPFSVIVMNTILGFGGVLGVRVFRRILYKPQEDKPQEKVKQEDVIKGEAQIDNHCDPQIEVTLDREPYHPDEEKMKDLLTGKAVMVTGAGGSIGAELARQVARFQPSSLLLVERAEYSLLSIDRELRERWPELSIVPLLADICDSRRMYTIFTWYNPQVVLHAAAHKHIPMMEFNLIEAIKNNALATFGLGELAGTCGAEVFVLISTDKAARPTSVMGASKRIAELAVQCLNQRSYTRYVAVRFGTVIGSSISDAAQLAMQAADMGDGGEVFILDLGEDTGEFDEPRESEDCVTKTDHSMIRLGKIAAYPPEKVLYALQRLTEMAQAGQERELRRYLNDLLPEAQLEHRTTESTGGNEGDINRFPISLAFPRAPRVPRG